MKTAKTAKTKREINNSHEGRGYTIPANTVVEVLVIEGDKANIRGPGLAYTPDSARKVPSVVVRANLSDIEVQP